MFTIDKDELVFAVAAAADMVPQSTPQEQLQNIEIEGADDVLTVRASTGHSWCETRTDIDGDLDKVIVPAHFFEQVVSSMPDGRLKSSTIGKRLDITAEGATSRATIPVLADDKYPRAIPATKEPSVTISSDVLKEGIAKVAWIVDPREIVPSRAGILLEINKGGITFAGCSQQGMSEFAEKAPRKVDASIILPLQFARLIQKHFPARSDIKTTVGVSQGIFANERLTLASVGIEGGFAPYRAIFDKTLDKIKHRIPTNVAALRGAIARKTPFVGRYNGIRLTFDSGMLTVQAGHDALDSTDSIPSSYAGEEIGCLMAIETTQKLLSAFDGENVTIALAGPKDILLFFDDSRDESTSYWSAVTQWSEAHAEERKRRDAEKQQQKEEREYRR